MSAFSLALSIRRVAVWALLAASVTATSALVIIARSPAQATAALPLTMIWAWERPEDLRHIDPSSVGVAFLSRTIDVTGTSVRVRPRLQPLRVPQGTRLVAVVRVEHMAARDGNVVWTDGERATLIRAIGGAAVDDVEGVQIDFDARASERAEYRNLINGVRRALPGSVALSITALASWCLDDQWLDGLPLSEAVPMLFRMGPDGGEVRRRLEGGADFSRAICRQSVGRSTDEPALRWRGALRRTYWFHPRAWTDDALRSVTSEVVR